VRAAAPPGGAFADRLIQLLSKVAGQGIGRLFGLTPETPLTDLQGMNPWNAARLNEEGIDNVQNLATEDPSRLIVVTTEGELRILDWIDQATLFSAVGKKLRDDLAEQGINTSVRRTQVGPPLRRLLSR